MSYTLDYFVTNLECPVCGVISHDDGSTNMATKIRGNPQLEYIGIGKKFQIDFNNLKKAMNESGYTTIRLPQPAEDIKILQTWECPSRDEPFNWAEIVISDGIVKSISAIQLNLEKVEQSNFVMSDDMIYIL